MKLYCKYNINKKLESMKFILLLQKKLVNRTRLKGRETRHHCVQLQYIFCCLKVLRRFLGATWFIVEILEWCELYDLKYLLVSQHIVSLLINEFLYQKYAYLRQNDNLDGFVARSDKCLTIDATLNQQWVTLIFCFIGCVVSLLRVGI